MNGAVLLFVGAICFVVAYRFYGRYLQKLFGVDDSRVTPAHTARDGVDYVPTRLPVLFGHHFASIAGAGPIVGPVLAAYLGWGPVVLWIIFGCIFIGAMHDFASLFLSIRNGGRSIGKVIEGQLGYAGRQIFLLFSWLTLILVVAIFAILVAGTFVSTPSVATASLLFIAMAPLFGYLVNRRGLHILPATLIFVPLLFIFIWVGTQAPLDLAAILSTRLPPDLVAEGLAEVAAKHIWLVVLFVYAGMGFASTARLSEFISPLCHDDSRLCGDCGCRPSFSDAGVYGVVGGEPQGRDWTSVSHPLRDCGLWCVFWISCACGLGDNGQATGS